ncbi:hypothetical protein MMC34_007693 [Xylographa carneopallida]|nr:hypothetical protein [Xylographa carneopallida]
MAIRGQRFHLHLDSDEDESDVSRDGQTTLSLLGLDCVRDVSERSTVDAAKPPAAPTLKSSTTGFPAHKKRVRPSAFKQQRTAAVSTDGEALKARAHHRAAHTKPSGRGGHAPPGLLDISKSGDDDKKAIDEENQQKISQMAPQEIERERAELMAGMSASLIDRLLKRANIDEGRTDTNEGFGMSPEAEMVSSEPHQSPPEVKKPPKRVTFDSTGHDQDTSNSAQKDLASASLKPLLQVLQDSQTSSSLTPVPPHIHFPRPPEAPSLDPSDPNFLDNMHARYFPEFPVDPSKLAWMAPIPTEGSPADQDSPYNPLQESLTISSIRFDFRGRLIPPRLARQIPVTQGLHHHGQAPEAAGYTVPELAHLSRSSVAAQRCIAYQILGRVLYRLGRGDFGDEGEDLYLGLWKCIEEGRVVDTLAAEANKEDGRGNRSCKVTATEALWLWQKGGGKKWKAQ